MNSGCDEFVVGLVLLGVSGRSEEVAEAAAPRVSARCVAKHVHCLDVVVLDGILGLDVVEQSVPHRLGLLCIRTEEAIPDDEHTAIVLVDVGLVRSMVNAVVGRAVENELPRRAKLVDTLGMERDLEEETGGVE